MMVTSAQHVDCYEVLCWQGRWTVAKIIQSSRSGFSRLFAGLRRSYGRTAGTKSKAPASKDGAKPPPDAKGGGVPSPPYSGTLAS